MVVPEQVCVRGDISSGLHCANLATACGCPSSPESRSHQNRGQGWAMHVEILHIRLCCITWLQLLLTKSEEAGLPITNYLTRVQARDRQILQEKGVSSAELANRVKKHFEAADIYNGQSTQNSRRESMQHDVHNLSKSKQSLGEAAQIRTPGNVARYLDLFRHLP